MWLPRHAMGLEPDVATKTTALVGFPGTHGVAMRKQCEFAECRCGQRARRRQVEPACGPGSAQQGIREPQVHLGALCFRLADQELRER